MNVDRIKEIIARQPNLSTALGMEFISTPEDDTCMARMKVDERNRQPFGFLSGGTDPIAIEIYERFKDSEIGKDILSPKSLREFKINMDSELNPKNESSDFVGYIDRINFKNNNFELIDFKTGKYPEKQDFSQLMYYGVWFLQRFPESQNVKLRYVYVEHLNEHSAIFDRGNLDLIKSTFLEDIKSIETCEDFTKNPTPLCNWCEFCNLCKF